MGIIADIFASDLDHAKNYESSVSRDREAYLQSYTPIEFRNLTDLNISVLWALITDEEWDLEKHKLENIEYGEDGETWLFQFPELLCIYLSNLTPEKIALTANEWAKTEELEGWSVSDTKSMITKLVDLIDDAKTNDLGVFLWGSI